MPNERPIFYSPELGSLILDLYVQGASLHQISELDEMPSYTTILRWARSSDKFKGEFENARLARALHLEERALALADEAGNDPDLIPSRRFKFDVFKWAAEVGDPSRYGKKVTVGGDASRPIVFRVVTGVPAPLAPPTRLDASGLVISGEEAAVPSVALPPPAAANQSLAPATPTRELTLLERLEQDPYKPTMLPPAALSLPGEAKP